MYKSDEKGDRYECDNCGAKLPAPEPNGTRTCSYCGSVFTTKQDPSVPGGYTFVVQSPPTIDLSQYYNSDAIVSATKTASRAGCIISIVITVVVLAATAIPVYFALKDAGTLADFGFGSSSSSGAGYRISADSGVILPSEPSKLEVAVRGDKYEDGASRAYLFGVGGSDLSQQWKTSQLGDDAYSVPMAADANNVYAIDGKKVVAFRRTDGGQVWQGSLSDTAPGQCDGCITVVGTSVVVHTSDGRLQAFAVADGKPSWQRDLSSVSSPAVKVGGQLVLIDGQAGDDRLVVVDPATGTDLHVLDAQCSDANSTDSISSSASINPSPDDNTFIVGFGTIPSCLQRWDAATGALVWTQTLDSGTSFGSFYDTPAVWSGTLVALPSSNEVMVVDRNTGGAVTTVAGASEEYWPIGFTENNLVTLVKDQRGTADYFIRGLNTTSWAQSFQTTLDGTPTEWAASTTVTSSETYVATHLSGTNVRIVSFDGQQQDFVVQSVDTTTGTATGEQTVESDLNATIPSFSVVGWAGDTAVLIAGDDLFSLDTANPTGVKKFG